MDVTFMRRATAPVAMSGTAEDNLILELDLTSDWVTAAAVDM